MSDLTDAMAELMGAYQEASESTPVASFGGEDVEIIPAAIGQDQMFGGGGSMNAEEFEVATLFTDWNTPPEDLEVVELSGHATKEDGSYQVLRRRFHEAWLVLVLGNTDAR